MNTLWSLIVVLAAAFGLFALFLFFGQHSLIYYPQLPTRNIVATPDDIGLDYEEITIITEDRLRLNGWYLPARQARAVLLFFHGNAGNISHRLDSLRIFHGLGLSILIFDYRGYGKSEGSISEMGSYRDAEAAWRYLRYERHIAAEDIILFGRSMGGAIAAYLASRQRPKGLIVESTFTSVPELAADLYPYLPAKLLSRVQYDTRAYLDSVVCPLLIVHSTSDDIIPFNHGEALFAAARDPKYLLSIRGSHNEGFLDSGQQYIDGLRAFIDRLP